MSDEKTALAPAPPEKPAPITLGNGMRGIELRTLDDIWRFAGIIEATPLPPKGMESRQSIVIAIQLGLEVGVPPLAAIQNIAVINGRPTIYGDLLPAVCMQSPNWDPNAFTEWFEGLGPENTLTEHSMAVCRVRRKGGQVVERSFSVADAKKAGLWGKAGPWVQYPKRMLQMRARSWAMRDTFPDALKGMIGREEAEDLIDVEPTPARPVIQPPRRLETPTPPADPIGPVAGEVVDEPPPDHGEPDGCPSDAQSDTPSKNLNVISDKQRKRLYAIYKGAGKTDDQMKAYLMEIWGIDSSRDITLDMYDDVCKWAQDPKNTGV